MLKQTVSVLMPAFNASATIGQAIKSVLNQTYEELEIIVVDDGSTDGTVQRVEDFMKQDKRVQLFKAAHEGVARAANRTIKESKGSFLARLDADDYMEPERLEEQLNYLINCEAPEKTLVGSKIRFFPREKLGEGTLKYEKWLNSIERDEDHARHLLVENTLAHPTILGHRSLFEGVRGYREGAFPEDYDLTLRLRSQGTRMYTIPQVLTHWREHGDRLTHTDERYSFESFRRAKAMHIKRMYTGGQLAPDRPLIIWGAGSYGKRFMRALEEQALPFTHSIDIDPRKVGRSIRSGKVEVIAPEQLKSIKEPFVLLAVATPGAREEIRDFLMEQGLNEVQDFLAVQ